MEWLFDPTIWIGLLTLVTLEIVLGIDNLIFIAILTDKLPPAQRNKARIIGLSLAMVMRLILLSLIFWIVTLTRPLFALGSLSFSGRDLILLLGGLFLLFKATVELHERLEGVSPVEKGKKIYASFSLVLTQIVILDAVFSLDSVITAVGMVNELAVMMVAVIISIGVMILASKPLTRFVNAHQTVVVLCLSFLLMIGFSLVAEGFGFKIPKGYLYAAIGFSTLIEFFNQMAYRNLQKHESLISFRERTAAAVLNMLGGAGVKNEENEEETPKSNKQPRFAEEERFIVRGALTLGERTIRSIMTVRSDISWIDLNDPIETLQQQILETPHSFLLVCRDNLDNFIGIARAKDLIANILAKGTIDEEHCLKTPVVLDESWGVIKAMEMLKRSSGRLLVIVDEYGTVKGVLTPIDILEAIAGEFPDEDEQLDIQPSGENTWTVDGSVDLYHLEQTIHIDFSIDNNEYTSLAGFLLARFNKFPGPGDTIELDEYSFEVKEIIDRRIATVIITKIANEKAD